MLKKAILAGLEQVDWRDGAKRQEVYQAAFNAIHRLPENKHEPMKKALLEVVEELELSYILNGQSTAEALPISSLEPTEASHIPAAHSNETQSTSHGDDNIPLIARQKKVATTHESSKGSIFKSTKFLIGAAIFAVYLLSVFILSLFDMPNSRDENIDQVRNESLTTPVEEGSPKLETDTELRALANINFAEGQSGIDIIRVETNETIAALPTENGYPVLSEKLNIFLKDPIKIEPGTTYLGRVVIRVPKDWDKTAIQPYLHVGSWNLSTIDQPLAEDALSLFVINDRLFASAQPDQDGNISFSATISASDAEDVSNLPISAQYFRPFIGFNPEGSEIPIELISYAIYLLDPSS